MRMKDERQVTGQKQALAASNGDKAGANLLDIICFANIEWTARFQRPQQLMSQFAQNGYRVFYIVASKVPQSGGLYDLNEIIPGVFEVALQVNAIQNFYGERMTGMNVDACLECLDALSKDMRIKSAVSVVHLPYWAPLTRQLRLRRDWRIQYDCMDDWVDFPHFTTEVLEEEKQLVAEADLVTVTASLLHDKWAQYSRNCMLVRNGVDFDFFSSHCVPNELLPAINRPIIGFYGALAEWVDFELLAALARMRPEWNFVLIGDVFVEDLAGLESMKNVHLLGKKPYADMPAYLYRFDVCLIPFRLYNVTHAVDPVKFYEFISAGKPVVSVPLDEMRIYNDFVFFANDAQGFVKKIELALQENDLALCNRRIELARRNDWKDRFAHTRDAIVHLYAKASIIVVTYNNVHLTKQCIDSILRNTTYPNIEIIVVDNGSSDDTRNYLRYVVRTHPNISIILNDTNRGFSAANNQGLRLASGHFLVLLNNDTVVPKGWLDPLLRHLEDPAIGLVGPVTNSIGNEAKIEVDYDDLDQMEVFSDQYVATHQGRVFDISMLAMFCVAMRRDVLDKVGLLDEEFGVGMFEDDDYSRRIQDIGLRTVCAEDSFVHHFGQASFKKLIASGEYQKIWDKNQAYFEKKWGKWEAHSHRLESQPISSNVN
ncbi:MAG: glycosyltransferase [Pseudomonadota bacterium]